MRISISMLFLTLIFSLSDFSIIYAQATINDADFNRIAKKLVDNPNDPKFHLDMAVAYFRRGMQGDAKRVYKHVGRAVDLSPNLEKEAEKLLREAAPGFRAEPRSPDQRWLDQMVASTIPVLFKNREKDDPVSLVERGLGEKMARRNFHQTGNDYESIKAEFIDLFGLNKNERESSNWNERFDQIKNRGEAKGWTRIFSQSLADAAEQTNNLRDEQKLSWIKLEDQKFPDPITEKNKAYMAYRDGDIEGCVSHLLSAAAASETLDKLGSASIGWDGGNSVRTGPPNEQSFTGSGRTKRANISAGGVNVGISSTDGSAGINNTDQQTPLSNQAGREAAQENTASSYVPPDLNRRVAQSSLEAAEAIGNENVPIEEVEREMTEVGSLGVVGEPLLIDIDNDGKPGVFDGLLPDGRLSGQTVKFDLDADGWKEQVEWLKPNGDGLLAVDLDGDGAVSSGKELFGTAFGDLNGFERLARFDIDGNGIVEGREASLLKIWIDNGDGLCQPNELHPLSYFGIRGISVTPYINESDVYFLDGSTRRCWEWMPDIRM